MNRFDFQQLAADRISDGEALLAAHRWAGAYYLAGYAVECGLKSCVLARVSQATEIIFEDRKFSEKCWTHNLLDLVKLAGLEAARASDMAANAALANHWAVVKDWSEQSRYKPSDEAQARLLFHAITDSENGVLPWIRARW